MWNFCKERRLSFLNSEYGMKTNISIQKFTGNLTAGCFFPKEISFMEVITIISHFWYLRHIVSFC